MMTFTKPVEAAYTLEGKSAIFNVGKAENCLPNGSNLSLPRSHLLFSDCFLIPGTKFMPIYVG